MKIFKACFLALLVQQGQSNPVPDCDRMDTADASDDVPYGYEVCGEGWIPDDGSMVCCGTSFIPTPVGWCCGGDPVDRCNTKECCNDEIKTSANGICCTDSSNVEAWTDLTTNPTLEQAACCDGDVINTDCQCCQKDCNGDIEPFQFESSCTSGEKVYDKCPKVSKTDTCEPNRRQLEGGKRKGRRVGTRRKLSVVSGTDDFGVALDATCASKKCKSCRR